VLTRHWLDFAPLQLDRRRGLRQPGRRAHPDWDKLLARPEVADLAVWDLMFGTMEGEPTNGVDNSVLDTASAALSAGSAQATAGRLVVPVNGVGVSAFDFDNRAGQQTSPITFAVTAGRAPVDDREVAIGPKTADDLGVGIGDTIEVGDEPLRIVGKARFPPDVHAEFDEGLWVSKTQFDAMTPKVDLENPAAALIANALTPWPARRIARLRPARVLRAEQPGRT
jgi:hypothetical protein